MSAQINGGIYAKIYRCVACIPEGKVATYGQIAQLVSASGARQVGYALSATPPDVVIPWHRVINVKGEVSTRSSGVADSEQQRCLIAEGVVPDKKGRIDLAHYRWQPRREDFLNYQEEEQDLWLDQPGMG